MLPWFSKDRKQPRVQAAATPAVLKSLPLRRGRRGEATRTTPSAGGELPVVFVGLGRRCTRRIPGAAPLALRLWRIGLHPVTGTAVGPFRRLAPVGGRAPAEAVALANRRRPSLSLQGARQRQRR